MSIAEAAIGHNSGAHDTNELIERTLRRAEDIEKGSRDYCEAENPDLMRRLREIESLIARGLPSKVETKAEAEKLSDTQFAIKKWISAAKQARTAAKRPWDNIAKAFFAFFTRPIEALEEVADEKIAPVLQAWQDAETSRIKREAEEQARILREEADKRAREAAEAETRRLAAERREREAKEAAERAEQDRIAAIERAAKARAEAEEQERRAAEARKKAEAEDKARRDLEAKRKVEAEEQAKRDADEKAERDRKRAEWEAEEKARLEAFKKQEADAKAEAAKLLQDRRAAERDAVDARKEQRAEKRNESEAIDAAVRADKQADKKEEKAGASPAELSRIRGEAGSVSSLRTFWSFRNISRGELDLEQLRAHLPIGALETAVRSFIDAGGRSLKGVEIFEDQTTTTR